MSHLCSIVFLALFLSLTYTTTGEIIHALNNQGTQTYIVSIQNDLKSSKIANVEDWYKFILSKVNSDPNDSLLHVYKTVFHGFSARLRPEQASLLKAQAEVNEIFPDHIYQLHTTRSPYFLGLNTYHKPKGLLKDSDLGSNVVIGVIDSGIWPESPSFNDEGMGSVPAHFKGVCDGGEDFPPSLCNKKLVGVRHTSSFESKNIHKTDTARDKMGHGTHTASTMAGRARASNNCSFFGYAKGEAIGIAPKARLAVYKVCSDFGCLASDVLWGIDKAVEDGVDVMSLSLGSEPSRYNLDTIAIGAFGALQKGVIVSASAGNSGPVPASLSNSAPWIITVGASTIDREFRSQVILDNGVALEGSSLYTGKPLPSNKTFPLIHFSSHEFMKRCMPHSLNKKDVEGKIVVCMSGLTGPVEKGLEVKRVGGVGVIYALNDPKMPLNDTIKSDPFLNPGVTIPYGATSRLLDYIGNKTVKEATLVFLGTQIGKQPAPVVTGFSSRGPNTVSKYVLKPDLIAPGKDILAAWPNNVPPSELPDDPRRSEFNILTGTSMSCPHVSGVAALLKGAHPDWTPSMIRSALMTTAYTGYRKMAHNTTENSKVQLMTFYDIGAGHIDPEKANNPGLVLDITEDDYIQFLCASNYNATELHTIVRKSVSCDSKPIQIWDLNYPAIIVTPDMDGKMVKRTLTSVDSAAFNYTAVVQSPEGTKVSVIPAKLSFKTKGEKQRFTVTVTALGKTGSMQSKAMGSVTWTDGTRKVTIPLMVA